MRAIKLLRKYAASSHSMPKMMKIAAMGMRTMMITEVTPTVTALRKRAVDQERVDRMISGIVRQLESTSDGDVASEEIGRLVMEALRGVDDVAYVRFASVYRDFREARDFETLISELASPPTVSDDKD